MNVTSSMAKVHEDIASANQSIQEELVNGQSASETLNGLFQAAQPAWVWKGHQTFLIAITWDYHFNVGFESTVDYPL